MTLDFAVRKLDNTRDGNLKISIPKSLTIALTRMIHYTCVLLTSTLSSGQIWKFTAVTRSRVGVKVKTVDKVMHSLTSSQGYGNTQNLNLHQLNLIWKVIMRISAIET